MRLTSKPAALDTTATTNDNDDDNARAIVAARAFIDDTLRPRARAHLRTGARTVTCTEKSATITLEVNKHGFARGREVERGSALEKEVAAARLLGGQKKEQISTMRVRVAVEKRASTRVRRARGTERVR